MAYEGNTNAASYITAGIAGGDAFTSNLKATANLDFTGIAGTIKKAAAQREKALIQGKLKTDVAQMQGDALVKATKDKYKDSNKPRMAGKIAALALNGASGYMTGSQWKKVNNEKFDTEISDLQKDYWNKKISVIDKELNGNKTKQTDLSGQTTDIDITQLPGYRNPDEIYSDAGLPVPGSSGPTGSGLTGSGTKKSTSAVSASNPQTEGRDFLTGTDLEVANAIGATEGGDWGYDAINQGGTHGGYKAINSGSYTEMAGMPLTSLTIKEVMDRQSGWDDRSITDAQWRNSGKGVNTKIWAAGNFQFIPKTLKSVVASSGIDVNRKFDRYTQQELFKHHARSVGSFQPWWGTHGRGYESKYASFFK